MATFGIGLFLQLQAGAQSGSLLNSNLTKGGKDSNVTDLTNRFDYGFAGGAEVFSVKGLLAGVRYNSGLGKLYKHYEEPLNNPAPKLFPTAV